MVLLLGLALVAVGLLITGTVWAALKVRRYRSETEERRQRAFAGMAVAIEEARKSKKREASGEE